MILILTPCPENQAAAAFLSQQLRPGYAAERDPVILQYGRKMDLSGVIGDTLILLNVSEKTNFQENCTGRAFASILREAGLPQTVTRIEIIISDIPRAGVVGTFAGQLAKTLGSFDPSYQPVIFAYSDLNTASTIRFLSADSAESSPSWKIATSANPPNTVWQGEDIREWVAKTPYYPDTGARYTVVGASSSRSPLLQQSAVDSVEATAAAGMIEPASSDARIIERFLLKNGNGYHHHYQEVIPKQADPGALISGEPPPAKRRIVETPTIHPPSVVSARSELEQGTIRKR